MSKQFKNNSSANVKKPYCKVCHDAGKSESEYTSHYVKSLPDRNGNTKITCPTLLETECNYCHDLGHTAKFCVTLAKDNKRREYVNRKKLGEEPANKAKKENKEIKGNKNKTLSRYAALDMESSDEEEEAQEVSFPKLLSPEKIENMIEKEEAWGEAGRKWADLAAKPKPTPKPTEQANSMIALAAGFKMITKNSLKREEEEQKQVSKTPNPVYKRSWADLSDTEDEDEDEDVEDDISEKVLIGNSWQDDTW